MRERNLIICDDDREFVARLGGYISRKEDSSFQIVCFSDRGKMKEYLADHEADAVLAGESWEKEEFGDDEARWFTLTEGDPPAKKEGRSAPTVCKYQAAEDILRQVMQGLELPDGMQAVLDAETELFGVYAPGGWTDGTQLALAIARRLGKSGPTVYLGLNEFSVAGRLLGSSTGRDMSDLAYCWRRGRLGEDQLERMVIHRDGYDCVPAPANPAELAELKEKDAKELIETVCQAGGYRYAVLDFGGSISGWLSLFGAAGRNYVLFPETETGSLQRAVYEEFWNSIGADGILSRSRCEAIRPEEFRGNRRERTEEYMDELAERLLQSEEDVERDGGAVVCGGDRAAGFFERTSGPGGRGSA